MEEKTVRVALVVPSIRRDSFAQFVQRWGKLGMFGVVDLILVEDNPTRTFDVEPIFDGIYRRRIDHYCWQDIDDQLGNDSDVIPRRSDTVRSFGYLKAWESGADYVLTLDDDCYPPTADEDGVEYPSAAAFVEEHVSWLTSRTKWVNTLKGTVPRGIPYFRKGTADHVVINHGLWTNVLDFDAPRQLVAPVEARPALSFSNQVIPAGFHFPMCGMNVAWHRDATVLMYHLLMGRDSKGALLPFDRFGDIWCGVIAKKVLDSVGLCFSSGLPYVRHERASDPFANIRKEANGLGVNERLWEVVDGANVFTLADAFVSRSARLIATYQKLAIGLEHDLPLAFPEHSVYFERLCDAMLRWSDLIVRRAPKGG